MINFLIFPCPKINLFCTYIWLIFWLDTEYRFKFFLSTIKTLLNWLIESNDPNENSDTILILISLYITFPFSNLVGSLLITGLVKISWICPSSGLRRNINSIITNHSKSSYFKTTAMNCFLSFCWSGSSAGFGEAVVLPHRGQQGSLTQSHSAGCWGGLEAQRLHSHLCCLHALSRSFFLQVVFILWANLSFLAAWQLALPKRAKLKLPRLHQTFSQKLPNATLAIFCWSKQVLG